MKENESTVIVKDAKKVFIKLGSCSRTLFFLMNRDSGYLKENEEHAADPLAGGLMKKGHQCGMVWGASLAAGADAFRRYKNSQQAISVTINTTRDLINSFVSRAGSLNCLELTSCDWTSVRSMFRYFLSGRFISCFSLVKKWTPEAILASRESLGKSDFFPDAESCASVLIREMGGTEEEMVMVSGFAGGLGLCGNACGALSAAIWKKTLEHCRKNSGKSAITNPDAAKLLEKFTDATGGELLCSKITGQKFNTVEEHSHFIKNNGCDKLIQLLSQS